VSKRGSLIVFLAAFLSFALAPSAVPQASGGNREIPFPLPSTIRPEDAGSYQGKLLEWLKAKGYVTLKWSVDKGIRDTGPWINDVYYGTHKAARIYYSPNVMEWLEGGRKGVIPDGAMIIKEQFKAPAARFQEKTPPDVTD
jgi:hypothetical protein